MIMKMKSEKDVTNEMPWVLRIHEIGCLSIKLFLVLYIPCGTFRPGYRPIPTPLWTQDYYLGPVGIALHYA